MSWAKLDDGFGTHPKTMEVSNDAIALHIVSLTYCSRHLTDGVITLAATHHLCALRNVGPETVAELVKARMWNEIDSGYQVHDYLDYNPSRAQVLEDRAANTKRQAEWQAAHRDKIGRYNAVSNDVTNTVANTAPSRPGPVPVPKETTREPNGSLAPKARAKAPQPNGKLGLPRADQAMFSALVAAFGAPETASERGRYNKAGSELRCASPPVLPENIPKIKMAYEQRWPKIDCTPTAIAANLGILRGGNGAKSRSSPEPQRDSPEYYEAHKYDNLGERVET